MKLQEEQLDSLVDMILIMVKKKIACITLKKAIIKVHKLDLYKKNAYWLIYLVYEEFPYMKD